MRDLQLLTTTSITSVSAVPDLLSLRKKALRMVDEDRVGDAIHLLRFALFHSDLRHKSEMTKKSVFRSVWSAIEKSRENRFEAAVHSELLLLVDANDQEWCEEITGLSDSIRETVAVQLAAERSAAVIIGTCAALTHIMCVAEGVLVEEHMATMADILAGI